MWVIILKLRMFEKISILNIMKDKINENIIYYGDDIEKIRKDYIKLIIFIPIIAIVSIILLKFSPYFILLNLISIFIYLYPLIATEIKKEEQEKIIENEIPIFLLFAYVNSLLGKSLYKTFEEIKNSKVFKGMKREALLLIKEVEVLGKSSISAMESRAKVHKSDFLGKIYMNYVNGEMIGISVSERIRDLLEESLDNLKSLFESYVNKSNDVVEIIFILYLITPMILLAFQYISTSINIFTLLVPLIISPVVYFFIVIAQPNMGYEITLLNAEKKALLPIIITVFFSLFLHISLTYKLVILYSLFVCFSFLIYYKIKYSDDILNNMPYVLSDIADYVRLGYSIRSSLFKIRSNNRNFMKFLDKIINNLRKNLPISEVKTNIWAVNAILEFIENIEKKGFADTFTFKDASILLSNYIALRNKILKSLQLFHMLSIMTPLMLYFAFGLMSKIKAIGNLDFIILIYSIILSIIYAKLSRFTIFNFPLLLAVLLTMLIIIFLGNIIIIFI